MIRFFVQASVLISLFLLLNTTYANELKSTDHDKWLQEQYGAQHQQLIPVVAVADMFFACNNESRPKEPTFTLDELVNDMDKDELAIRLSDCLGEYSIKSEQALNYGLRGCFQSQVAHLPAEESQQKMKLVNSAIGALSREDRQKSFTQCVTDQSIKYLK